MLFRLDRENQSLTTSNSISHVCKSNFGIATPVNDALTNICIRDLLRELRNGSHFKRFVQKWNAFYLMVKKPVPFLFRRKMFM